MGSVGLLFRPPPRPHPSVRRCERHRADRPGTPSGRRHGRTWPRGHRQRRLDAAFQPMTYQASYAATKAIVLSFTEAHAEEVRGTGVRVMAAHPGALDTGFFDGTTASMDPKTTDTPADVAASTLDDCARGRSISFPGRASNRAGTWASRLLPRTTIARITGNLNRKAGFDAVRDLGPATP
ncbi:SDR family NAD(P)-dependent oxidoreductase [Streptomyces sp. NPDC048416]|uniref:SDR family NAD(P)-dependent oxidoreductase n=1 Tax=Streptomyces sp. NPDC048416 TaxID=3365546 RepID=UPI0037213540